jgi:hypothetical protein
MVMVGEVLSVRIFFTVLNWIAAHNSAPIWAFSIEFGSNWHWICQTLSNQNTRHAKFLILLI